MEGEGEGGRRGGGGGGGGGRRRREGGENETSEYSHVHVVVSNLFAVSTPSVSVVVVLLTAHSTVH